jgi:hypothetical protein
MSDITMAGLEADGYCGQDFSLEVSLRDYGLAWYTDEGENFSFIYGSASDFDEDDGFRRFYTADRRTRDFFLDFSWADFYEVACMVGDAMGDWLQLDYPRRVADLISYYGYENVFGTEYFEGFEIGDSHSETDQ